MLALSKRQGALAALAPDGQLRRRPLRQEEQLKDAIRKDEEEEVARLILEEGADTRDALRTAVESGSLRVLRRLLAPPISLDPNEQSPWRLPGGPPGGPPLAFCAYRNAREMFEALLAAGARGKHGRL